MRLKQSADALFRLNAQAENPSTGFGRPFEQHQLWAGLRIPKPFAQGRRCFIAVPHWPAGSFARKLFGKFFASIGISALQGAHQFGPEIHSTGLWKEFSNNVAVEGVFGHNQI